MTDPARLWLGGAPCAGKSTVARQLAERHGWTLYHADNAFNDHLAAATAAQPTLYALRNMGWDAIWQRPLNDLLASNIAAYEEEWSFIQADLAQLPPDKPILIEGCALLPALVAAASAPADRVVTMIPTAAFQTTTYAQRPWVASILAACSQPEQAWRSWMMRDHLFARYVATEAARYDFPCVFVDGNQPVSAVVEVVDRYFTAPAQPTRRIATVLLAYDNGDLVLQLRDDVPTIAHPNTWSLFGGGIEPGESPFDAAIREIAEELTITLAPSRLSFLYQFEHSPGLVFYVFHYGVSDEMADAVLHEGQRWARVPAATIAAGQIANRPISPPTWTAITWYWQHNSAESGYNSSPHSN